MIVTEPILLLMSMYIALIYGLLYAFFFSFPVVFGEDYRWNDGLVGLTFCSVLIGVALALFVTPRVERDYLRRANEKGGRADPEDRLVGMMIGCSNGKKLRAEVSVRYELNDIFLALTHAQQCQSFGRLLVGPVTQDVEQGIAAL